MRKIINILANKFELGNQLEGRGRLAAHSIASRTKNAEQDMEEANCTILNHVYYRRPHR